MFLFFLSVLFVCIGCSLNPSRTAQWETLEVTGQPTARHEAAFVAYASKLYLMGGRRINPTDEFDIASTTWKNLSAPPLEIHHFQPVVVDDAIYILGAMTGGWPNEKPLDKVLIYYPDRDEYKFSHTIPEHRRRGGAGVAYFNGKIYIVGGITNGHMNGYKPWLDEYDPETGEWKILDDAPNARDHFQAVVVNNKLYAFAGRTTSKATNQDMALTTAYGNIYDFLSSQWLPVSDELTLPTLRAGNAAFVSGAEVVVVGGESDTQLAAFSEVEAFNTLTHTWSLWPSLNRGRHGSGTAIVDGYVYIASGSGNHGGGPELTDIERLKLPLSSSSLSSSPLILQPGISQPRTSQSMRSKSLSQSDNLPVLQQWHTLTLDFEGLETSE